MESENPLVSPGTPPSASGPLPPASTNKAGKPKKPKKAPPVVSVCVRVACSVPSAFRM